MEFVLPWKLYNFTNRKLTTNIKSTQKLRFLSFVVDANPPILEILRIMRRTSDFGVLDINNNFL